MKTFIILPSPENMLPHFQEPPGILPSLEEKPWIPQKRVKDQESLEFGHSYIQKEPWSSAGAQTRKARAETLSLKNSNFMLTMTCLFFKVNNPFCNA